MGVTGNGEDARLAGYAGENIGMAGHVGAGNEVVEAYYEVEIVAGSHRGRKPEQVAADLAAKLNEVRALGRVMVGGPIVVQRGDEAIHSFESPRPASTPTSDLYIVTEPEPPTPKVGSELLAPGSHF